jgi:hypothetical protein
MSDILKDFAVKSLGITDDRFAEILYSDDKVTVKETALDELLRLDAERVKSLKAANKDELTAKFNNGHQKGLAEGLGKFEATLKEQFGVGDSTAQGVDLVKEILVKQGQSANIDDEKVKLHPLYRKLEVALEKDYIAKSEYEKVTQEFDGYKNGVEKEKVMHVVKSDALKAFRSFEPVLSADTTKALNQELDFLNKLGAYEYEIQMDGSHIIKVDGKRLENAQGHPVSFNDFVKTQADKYFDFKVQTARENAHNHNTNVVINNVTVPKTKQEYLVALNNESDPVKKVALMNAWKEQNK